MSVIATFNMQISTSAQKTRITVTLTPTAPTPRARSTARVIRDTLEMESRALVCLLAAL